MGDLTCNAITLDGQSMVGLLEAKQDSINTSTNLDVLSITLNGQDITSTLSTKQDILNSTSNIEVLSINLDGDDLSELLGSKQNNLSIYSHVNLGSLTLTSDTLVVSTGTPGEIICESIILNGENITETMASYGATATSFTSGQIVSVAQYDSIAFTFTQTDKTYWRIDAGDTDLKSLHIQAMVIPEDDVYVDITYYAQGFTVTNPNDESVLTDDYEFRFEIPEYPESSYVMRWTYSNFKRGSLASLFPYTYRYTPVERTSYVNRESLYPRAQIRSNSNTTLDANIYSGYFFFNVMFVKK